MLSSLVVSVFTHWLLSGYYSSYLVAPMSTGSANLRPLKISWDPENKWLIVFHGTRSDGDHRTFSKSFARWEGSGCGSNLSPLHCVPTTNIPLQICFLCSALNSAFIFPPYSAIPPYYSAIFRLLFRHFQPSSFRLNNSVQLPSQVSPRLSDITIGARVTRYQSTFISF